MSTVGTPFLWSGLAIFLVLTLAIDLFFHERYNRKYSVNIKRAAAWSLVYIVFSLLFCVFFWYYLVLTVDLEIANSKTLAFLTGYLIEKALAVDNIFVWLMLFSYFTIPISFQRRVLVCGVLSAIVLRTVMIFSGSWLISRFKWLFYIFGLFLLFTGMKLILAKEDQVSIGEKPLVKWIRNYLRIIDIIENEKFFIRKNGFLHATPLFLALILVELSDVIFAIDSIPAVFAVTTDPFIVLSSNLFAVLGLRTMYFLLLGAKEHCTMLKYGLSVILMFTGFKMIAADFYYISVIASLSVVLIVLASTLIISIIVDLKNKNINHKHQTINDQSVFFDMKTSKEKED